MTTLPSPADDNDAVSIVPPPPTTRRLRIVQALTVVAVLAALGAALYFRERLEELEQYGYAAVFVVGLVGDATVVLPLPGLAFIFVMGGIFNPWIVGIVGGVGQGMGELTGYMAGYSGQTWMDENRVYDRLVRWMQRYGSLTIFVLAVIPNPLFDMGGMIAGALRFPAWKFLASCIAGKVVKGVAFALAGYYGIEALFNMLG
jgi:uncharacterized membrane protein YdjX (TVP38/TMEM64 family)